MILKGLSSSSFISLGQLCDDGYIIGLHKKMLIAIKHDKIKMEGYCNSKDGLWDILLAPKENQTKKMLSCHTLMRLCIVKTRLSTMLLSLQLQNNKKSYPQLKTISMMLIPSQNTS